MKYQSIKGTRDLLPPESALWQHAESVIRSVFEAFAYREIRTPIFEATTLFSRSIGELTDIVSKEMYTFRDRGDESLTLRPEGTAAVLRSYLQNNLGEQSPLTKLYYLGPMFRQERPQAGRLRQFHQFGAEAIGATSPFLDAEMMVLAQEIFTALGIGDTSLIVNSVGCEKCRPSYKKLLIAELQKIEPQLSKESRARLTQNPLRVLDSKDENDRKLTAKAPLMKDHLCEECSTHFAAVQEALTALSVDFRIDGRLVRGLDYYTKTAFEITHSSLGSQDSVAGGGRYDLLIGELGGKPTPAVGFAAGMERLMIVLEKQKTAPPVRSPKLYLAAMDGPARSWAFRTACDLRRRGIQVETDYLDRSLKSQLRDANRLAAEFVLVIGTEELTSGSGKLKHMKTGSEKQISLSELSAALGSSDAAKEKEED